MGISAFTNPARTQDWEYCRKQLQLVSRTFALNIRVLDPALRDTVTAAYLLCRLLDTVEDAPNTAGPFKAELLERAKQLIQGGLEESDALATWLDTVKTLEGTEAELDLVQHTPALSRCLRSIPPALRQPVLQSAATMAGGMAGYAKRDTQSATAFLNDIPDLEEYCYYVAGTVGEMLTELFALKTKGLDQDALETLRKNAVAFGLGLQITNIAKDFVIDAQRGYCFVPRTILEGAGLDASDFGKPNLPVQAIEAVAHQLAQKALDYLDKAMTYTLAIPRRNWRVRLFCLWPLMMAAASLREVVMRPDALAQGRRVKISRGEVRQIMLRTTTRVLSNEWLLQDYEKMRADATVVLQETPARAA